MGHALREEALGCLSRPALSASQIETAFTRGAALKAGATEEEFAEVTLVAAALRAGAAVTHGTHLIKG